MKHRRWLALLMVATMPIAAGCSKVETSESSYEDPATLDEVDGSELPQVTLTEKAIERIGVETAAIVDGPGGRVTPYSSILYDPDGTTWVFTEVKPRTFHRVPVIVATIQGDAVILLDGPAVGTPVATVGVAELFGVEHGLGAH